MNSAPPHRFEEFICDQVFNILWENNSRKLPAPLQQLECEPKAISGLQFHRKG